MNEETRIALRNYDWLVRNRGLDRIALAWESDTLVTGDTGGEIEILCERGFTPATTDAGLATSVEPTNEPLL